MMFSKETLDFITAVGTAGAAVLAAISALIAAKAVRDAARAIGLNREAIRAQTFLHLISYEREIEFSKGMDVIRSLREDVQDKDLTDQHIRKVVDFLNHVAHMIRRGYVTPEHVLYLYTPSIEACREKLLGRGQWLERFRDEARSPKYYLHFEVLCSNLEALWEGGEVKWPDPPFAIPRAMRE